MIGRVSGRESFRALAKARRHRDGVVTVAARAGGRCSLPAVAYAIPRSAGNAVVRNRLRRRLRALVRAHAEVLVAGNEYLVSTGRNAVASDRRSLESDLLGALSRARKAGT